MNNRAVITSDQESQSTAGCWHAELSLGLAKTARGTVLKTCSHRGPLYVQKAFYPEGRELAHLYLLHPPGGMVSGDDLQINVNVADGAQALITTPGAGRVYRARPDRTLQQQGIILQLQPNSTLEWLPLENIIYPGAYTRLNMDVHLAQNSHFIGWEITCLGLKASGQPFDSGEMDQRLQIFREGRLKVRENLRLDEQQAVAIAAAGLAGHSVNALLVAGPFDDAESVEPLLDAVRAECDGISRLALAAVSLNAEFLQVRYLGDCSEEARLLFSRCWHRIRPELLQRSGCEPRIWAT